MALPDSFVRGGWRTTSFDSCATLVDQARGIAVQGTGKSHATLRALMSDTNSLFVDVIEDPKVKPGATLQICFANWNAQSYAYCQVPERPECTRITMDGRVLSGTVLVERAADGPRFRIELPAEVEAVSVGYLEPGHRSIGSSRFRADDLTSLGRVVPIRTSVITSEIVDDRLQCSRTARDPDTALLDPAGFE